jgi:hypothetical protein
VALQNSRSVRTFQHKICSQQGHFSTKHLAKQGCFSTKCSVSKDISVENNRLVGKCTAPGSLDEQSLGSVSQVDGNDGVQEIGAGNYNVTIFVRPLVSVEDTVVRSVDLPMAPEDD